VTISLNPPLSAPGCVLWLRGDLGISQVANSVSQWNDQSGNSRNFTQATGANQPTYVSNAFDGYAGVQFDGVNSFMQYASWGTAGVQTIIAVFIDNGTSVSGATIFNTSTGAGGGAGLVYDTTGWGADGVSASSSNSAFITEASLNSTFNVVAISYDSTVSTVSTKSFLNAKNITYFTGSGVTVNAVAGTANLGFRNDGTATKKFKGTLLELAVYSGQLTSGQINSISKYMALRYKMTLGPIQNNRVTLTRTKSSSNRSSNTRFVSTPQGLRVTSPRDLTGLSIWLRADLGVTTTTSSLSGTFNVSNGSATITATSTQNGLLTTGSQITFGGGTATGTYTVSTVANGGIAYATTTFNVSNGSPNVTASSAQTGTGNGANLLMPGSVITFTGTGSGTYTVSTVSGTSIVLTTNYTGTSAGAANATGSIVLTTNYTGTSAATATATIPLVSSWIDQVSGVPFKTAIGGLTVPSFSTTAGPNSLPAVVFGGLQGIQAASLNPVTGESPSFFTILKSSFGQLCYCVYYGTNLNTAVCFAPAGIGSRSFRTNGGGDDLNNGSFSTNWEAWSQVNNNQAKLFRYNGGNQVTDTAAPTTTPVQLGGTYLGAANNGSHAFTGEINEVIAYNRPLSSQEVLYVEQYLRNRTQLW